MTEPTNDDKWPLWTDDKGDDVHAKLRSLRSQEFRFLANDDDNITSAIIARDDRFLKRVYTEIYRYFSFLYDTWSSLAIMVTFGGVSVFDLGSMLVYAVGGTILLLFVLIFCLVFTIRPVTDAYKRWSERAGGGYSLVNSSNRRVFDTLTQVQFEAATLALSTPVDGTNTELDPQAGREFNLDIAKLLIRLAAVVYEYENEKLRDLIVKAANSQPNISQKPMFHMQQAPKAPSWIPWRYFWTVPGDAIKYIDLTEAEDQPPESTAAPPRTAGRDEGAEKIHKFCEHFTVNGKVGLEYETISHMGDTSSAVAGLFWKRYENWIVVVFKGTSPLEYGEWLSNLNTKFAPVGSHINGFKRVHKGFKERVFPEDSSKIRLGYGSTPYDTISLGIQTLAKSLLAELPDDERFMTKEKKKRINVWFTGHSLGCATATLTYSKFLNARGKHVSLRDAYLFAAPIVCDRESVDVFNAKMLDDERHPRTMWRITSGKDFVATCLPELGDFRDLVVSPNNAFAFAHLGTEIILRDGPQKSLAAGNHLPWGSVVKIVSKFSTKELLNQYKSGLLKKNTRRTPRLGDIPAVEYSEPDGDTIDPIEVNRIWWASLSQQIPFLVGRVFAHGTVNYIDQLDRVALGEVEWTTNYN